MTKWLDETPVAVCPSCGVDCTPWRPSFVDLDWRDDDECEAGYLAIALMAHRFDAHPVNVQLGDLVRYWTPWRGRILGSEVYRVDGIRADHDMHKYARAMRGGDDLAPLIGTSYSLVNPRRADDRCFPFVGEPDRPIVFEIVTEAPPVEVDLIDLLDWHPNHTDGGRDE